jgi:monovalent cation:H+ antiporter-2, CPA2 family
MDLVLTISVSLAAALVLGYATQRLGLSPIVGYLLAGIVVGPNTPGFIANHEIAAQLAEIGVVLLMFGVGLHFDLKELLSVRGVALPGAIGQSAAATALGAAAVVALGGGGWTGGLVYGLALSVASTVVLTRVLADHDELHTPAGHLAVGWTVVEDLLTVLILVLLPSLFPAGGTGAGEGPGAAALAALAVGFPAPLRVTFALGLSLLKIALLFLFVFLAGGRLIPWLLRRVAATHSRELFTLTVLVLALGIAFGSAKLFGVSMALGAFLAGMVVGRSDFSLRAATEALPMRDAFAVLFFVSVGMLFDPRAVMEAPWLAAATFAIIVAGKPLASLLVMLALGQPARTAFSVALALGQIGEFSFILAALGTELGILPQKATSALVAASILSIAVSPLLHRLSGPLGALARRLPLPAPRAALGGDPLDSPQPAADPRFRAVVVGYGPVGQTLVRLLARNGIASTIIEMNLRTARRLRQEGIAVVYGDAARRETLASAGVPLAGTLFLSASATGSDREILRLARELNPDIRILARSSYLRERPALRAAGADAVFTGEGEVALAMTEAVLRQLGATPEQIEREREALLDDIGGDTAGCEGPPAGPHRARGEG